MDFVFSKNTGRFVAAGFDQVQARKPNYDNKTVAFNAKDIEGKTADSSVSAGVDLGGVKVSDMADGSNNVFTDGSGNDLVFVTQ